jgi:hypothetical protein
LEPEVAKLKEEKKALAEKAAPTPSLPPPEKAAPAETPAETPAHTEETPEEKPIEADEEKPCG